MRRIEVSDLESWSQNVENKVRLQNGSTLIHSEERPGPGHWGSSFGLLRSGNNSQISEFHTDTACLIFNLFFYWCQEKMQTHNMVYMLIFFFLLLISLWERNFLPMLKLNEIPIGMGPLIPNGVFKCKRFYSVWTYKPIVIGMFGSL